MSGAVTELKVLIDAQTAGFTRGLARAERQLGGLRREHDRTSGSARLMAAQERDLNRALSAQSKHLAVLTLQYGALRRAMTTLGLQTAVTGFAGLAASVSAAAAGVVMLTSSLSALGAGLAVVGSAGLLALIQGLTVATLGLNDVGKALTTTGDAHEKALAKLTKPARAFVGEIGQLREAFREIKLVAQEGLFDGLTRAVQKAAPLLEPFKQVVFDTATTLGYLAERTAEAMAASAGDLKALGERNVITMRRFGDASINIMGALLDVFRAADPFIGHVTAGIVTFSKNVAAAAEKARSNGGLASFFFELRKAWDEWTSIIGKFAGVVFNVLKAASGPAHEMNAAIGGVLTKWKAWTGSDAGQRRMTKFFRDSLGPLGSMARLMGAIFETWVRLTSAGNGASMAFFDTLRTSLLPLIEDFALTLNEHFFPAFLELFKAITGYIRAMLPGLRPVGEAAAQVAHTIADVLDGISQITASLPGAGKLVAGIALGLPVLAGWLRLRDAIRASLAALGAMVGLSRSGRGRLASPAAIVATPTVAPVGLGAGSSFAYQQPKMALRRERERLWLEDQRARQRMLRDAGGVTGPAPRVAVYRAATSVDRSSELRTRGLARGLETAGGITQTVAAGASAGLASGMEKSKPVLRAGFAFAALNGIISGISSGADSFGGRLRDALSGFSFGLIPNTDQIKGKLEKALAEAVNDIKAKGTFDLGSIMGLGKNKLVFKADSEDAVRRIKKLTGGLAETGKISGETARAVSASMDQILRKLREVGGQGKLSLKEALALPDLGGDVQAKVVTPAVTVERAFADMRRSAGGSMRGITETVKANTSQIRSVLDKDTRQGHLALAANFRLAAAAVKASMKAGEISTKEGTAKIRSYLISALIELNPAWNRKQAGLYLHDKDPLSGKPMSAPGKARGGMLHKLPGGTQGDRLPISVTAAPGEDVAIFNRHQRKVLDTRLGDMGGLPGLFRNVSTPHHHPAAARGGMFESTAYGPPWNAMNGTGTTASGIPLAKAPTGRPGPYYVAVDPSRIPLHTKLKAWPNPFGYRGSFSAEDTGGAIKGNRLDFLDMIGRKHQLAWGRRMVEVALGEAGLSMTGGTPGAFKPKALKGLASGMQGMIGAMADGALNKYRDAAQTRLDAAASAAAPMDDFGSGVSTPGGKVPTGSLNLMGANPGLLPYAQRASQFGLAVSSGRRAAGALTNSGGVSHHGSGSALDLAGAAGSMLSFARYAAQRWGPRLEELIYSPLGFGIKNGRRVPPYAVADHYDHVHLADTDPSGVNAAAGALFSRLYASVGLPPRDAGTPTVNTKDAIPVDNSAAARRKRKKKKGPKKKITGPARPNLKKISGKAKKPKPKAKTKIPKRLLAMQTTDDAFDVNMPDLVKMFQRPAEDLAGMLATMEGAFGLTDEEMIVTLEDSAQHADLTNFLRTAEGKEYLKYLPIDPKHPDDFSDFQLEVVNQNGMDVQGKFVRGIAQYVDEHRQLLGLHSGVDAAGNPLSPPQPGTSLLGLLMGERDTISATSFPKRLGDRDHAIKRIKTITKSWNARFTDRKQALDQARTLSAKGKDWRGRVADNDARISTLRHYKDDIRTAITNGEGVSSPEAKKNLQWASNQIRDLMDDNRQLKIDKPTSKDPKISKRVARLRADALQDRYELEFLARDSEKFSLDGGVAQQWKGRLDYDNTDLANLIDRQRTLNISEIPIEGLEIQRLVKEMGIALGSAVNYKIPDPVEGSGTGEDENQAKLNDLLKEQLADLRKQLALSETQGLVISGMAPLLNARFVGAFKHGGVIPQDGLALMHRGERVTPEEDGPFFNRAAAGSSTAPVNVEVNIRGDIDLRRVDARVDGRAAQVVSQQLGRRSRIIASAPGGNR